jgi:cysteine desulfuration protein SufE
MATMQTFEQIEEDFEYLDDWEDRYRYVIEIGRELPDMPDRDKSDANKVQGCVSQVWLTTSVKDPHSEDPVLNYQGDSDAHIVRGLVAIALAAYSGKRASVILGLDENDVFSRLGLIENITPQRANGLRALVRRIKQEAARASAAAAG